MRQRAAAIIPLVTVVVGLSACGDEPDTSTATVEPDAPGVVDGEPFPSDRCDSNRAAGPVTFLTGFDYAAGRWGEAGDAVVTGFLSTGGTVTSGISYNSKSLKNLAVGLEEVRPGTQAVHVRCEIRNPLVSENQPRVLPSSSNVRTAI